ncbi:hypothetical protein BT69DRAFT_1282915 [Atractiella rhizophila]|nr:hypothetical protein BT69DRAFT_1282915 [Atractiella rhizophila]
MDEKSNQRPLDRSRIAPGVARFLTPPPPARDDTLFRLNCHLPSTTPHAFRSLRSPPRRCVDEWLMCDETHLQNSGNGGVAADLEDWIGGSKSYGHKMFTDK